ncbi:MAG: carbamoyltransferase HypF [Planctomycetota bacterium]|nr:carbamoyltransferase HypF [Planctomycetota bacterium]
MVQPAPQRAGRETPDARELIRRRLACRGTVQGVGFRPAVHRLATRLGLAGSVANDADGATIELEGPAEAIESFRRELGIELPVLAHVDELVVSELAPCGERGFRVAESSVTTRRTALVPPDEAICPECRAELDDPTGRRHRYPFTTCTLCGPRFTVVEALPYDRERTSLARFPLCEDCAREYTDVRNRRFHAESTACPRCGPHVTLRAVDGKEVAKREAALERTRDLLTASRTIAIQGLGGFQLACRADDTLALARLRERKTRPTQPFAVMVRDLEVARRIARLTPADEKRLQSPRGPIVLVPRIEGALHHLVAPGLGDVGVMLPTTPLHVELFRDAPYDTLVMTSGNAHDEPICRTREEARAHLAGSCDFLLEHDREIVRRCDDSVVRSRGDEETLVRRSRGYVPEPLGLADAAKQPVLALGAHLQNTVALAHGRQVVLSQHIGDLDTDGARAFQREVIAGLEQFLQARATVVAVDLHPDYPATWTGEELARERGARLVRVQHHLAHAAAVLGEHQRFPRPDARTSAIVLDGTGLGPNGETWGAEWLVISGDLTWKRVGSARSLPLVGGERAIHEPWRVAVAALAELGEKVHDLPLEACVEPERRNAIAALATRAVPRARGAGRLFEAAGALLGLCLENTYEGEAAARFEALASTCSRAGVRWTEVQLPGDAPELPGNELLRALAARVRARQPLAELALDFHATFCVLAAELAERELPQDLPVALGGGCFVNRLLLEGLRSELSSRGFEVLVPQRLPPGDGGLAFGQCVVAAAATSLSLLPVFQGDFACASPSR